MFEGGSVEDFSVLVYVSLSESILYILKLHIFTEMYSTKDLEREMISKPPL